ncbi:MAG: PRC and DUF2382 domain-containing protein [Pseudomonadota bacterium]|nr:PRC and DUF2382 domain-containing protein [Pseudomonadota bacterium]
MAKDVMEKARLGPLGELDDYRVANGNPDIRGWEVYGADSQRLGDVRELIVDTDAMKARYMVVRLDRKVPNASGDRNVIVPIGRARLDDALDRVYVEDVTFATASTLPEYTAGAWTAERERRLFGGAGAYDRPEYDANRFFGERKAPGEAYIVLHEEKLDVGKRQVQAGEAVVRKTVETEHVRQTVPLMHEEVTVERRPLAPGAEVSRDVTIINDEVHIPLMAEELVAGKKLVAREEVVIKKTAVQEERVIEEDLKRERAEVYTPEGKKKDPV